MRAALRFALALSILTAGCGREEAAPPGAPATPEVASAPAFRPEADPSPLEARLRQRQEERARWLEENRDSLRANRAAREELEAELFENLEDPDPEVRADAAYYVDLDHPGAREKVVALGREDPDPRVRAAAAEALGDDDTYGAVTALLAMLDDPDPSVVVAAIEALEDVGDASLVGRLAALEEHPDSAVREAAREAIEYLE